MSLTWHFSWDCAELGIDPRAMQVCNKTESAVHITAEQSWSFDNVDEGCLLFTELSDAGVELSLHKLGWCRSEHLRQARLESQFFAMLARLKGQCHGEFPRVSSKLR